MSDDFRMTGNQEAPDGQSEHQPAERKLTGLLMSSRSAVYCASVVATGVALKPASVSDLTKASFAFAVSVSKSPWSYTSYLARPGSPGGMMFVAGIAFTPSMRPPASMIAL